MHSKFHMKTFSSKLKAKGALDFHVTGKMVSSTNRKICKGLTMYRLPQQHILQKELLHSILQQSQPL